MIIKRPNSSNNKRDSSPHSSSKLSLSSSSNNNEDNNNDEKNKVEWKGSTYSWHGNSLIQHRRRRRRQQQRQQRDNDHGQDDDDDEDGEYIKAINFKHCGTIEIHENPKQMNYNKTGVLLWSAAIGMAGYLDEQLYNHSLLLSSSSSSYTNLSRPSTLQRQLHQAPLSIVADKKDEDEITVATADNNNDGDDNKYYKNITMLELGAGLGLPTIVAAHYGIDCYATDIDDDVLSLLEDNLKYNFMSSSSSSSFDDDEYEQQKQINDNKDVIEQRDDSDDDDLMTFYSGQCKQVLENVHIQHYDWTSPINDYPILANLDPDIIIASDIIYGDTRPYWKSFIMLLKEFHNKRQRKLELLLLQQKEKKEQQQLGTSNNKEQQHGNKNDGYNINDKQIIILLGYTQRRRDLSIEEENEFFTLLKQYNIKTHIIPYNLIPNSDKYPLTTLFQLEIIT